MSGMTARSSDVQPPLAVFAQTERAVRRCQAVTLILKGSSRCVFLFFFYYSAIHCGGVVISAGEQRFYLQVSVPLRPNFGLSLYLRIDGGAERKKRKDIRN